MIHASLYERLGGDPISRTTRTGKPMVTASVAVNVARDGEESVAEWFNGVAFGRVADELGRHHKGDLVAITGRLTRSTFMRAGEERTSWGVTIEQIVSARTVRPGGRAKRAEDLFRGPAQPRGGAALPRDEVDDLWRDGLAP
jgi:single-strand DNA-binding protein